MSVEKRKQFINWLASFISINEETVKDSHVPIYRQRFNKENIKDQLSVIYTNYNTIMGQGSLDYYSKSVIIGSIVSSRYYSLKELAKKLDEVNVSANDLARKTASIYSDNCKIIADEISLLVHEQDLLDRAYKKSLEKM